jgi:hypothetical protein
MSKLQRVRHHTNDEGMEKIRKTNTIVPGRGWGSVETGVHVEVEPFGSARPAPTGGPRADLGCGKEGAFVEFDAPERIVLYFCGPRNTAVIPVPTDQTLSLNGLNPAFVKVRIHWWQFWRTTVE